MVKLKHLMNKRISGYLNWLRHRQYVHKKKTLDTLCNHMLENSPDHIAVTGDLVNLAIPQEFENALNWLKTLGSPEYVSVVPGNHDSYVKLPEHQGLNLWAQYMKSDVNKDTDSSQTAPHFPYLRYPAKDIALIGLSTSNPTYPFMATGTLGNEQLRKLKNILQELKNKQVFRVLLIHHPPLSSQTSRRRGLTDSAQLIEILKVVSVDLILHGHNHQNTMEELPSENKIIPIIGVGSASAGKSGKEPLATYNIYEIQRGANTWKCAMQSYGLTEPDGNIKPLVNLEVK